jgi:leucyl aminopeptidase
MGQGKHRPVKLLPERRKYPVRNVRGIPSAAVLRRCDVLLLLLPAGEANELARWPFGAALGRERARLPRSPGGVWSAILPTARATRVVVGELPRAADAFQQLTLAARVVREIVALEPRTVALGTAARGAPDPAPAAALLSALLAATEAQPQQKSRPPRAWQPAEVLVCGPTAVATTLAVENGAHLARWLTALPPNVLFPGSYRRALKTLAARFGWRMHVYGEAALKRLGAGAFTAVARGSRRRDAALVRLQYRPRGRRGARAERPIALLGKGICFDTGGHNLKSAKSMLDMHIDMAGSAVAVGALAALSASAFPRPVDAWLALAENRIGPAAYTQQDVVTAANGTTIQVTHTDAEGRMVLADSLALASRAAPACIIDFATLTGACVYALTERLSGAFTNHPALREVLERAGARSGERVHAFPTPADFDQDLDSPVADLVQCLIDGKGDHIYAARFLSRFVGAGIPWAHIDLSSASRSGGLAHVTRPLTGFGVRFAVALLADPEFHRALRVPPAAARA